MKRTTHETLSSHPRVDISLRNFSSQWFLVPQGTGIIAVILHQLDYQFRGLHIIADIFWVYTIALLVVMLVAYAVRIVLYPKQVMTALSTNIVESACLSSISITFTVIIQMIALTVVRDWSSRWGMVAYVLWWINTAMSVAACIGIPYLFVRTEPPGLSAVSPSIVLPLIAALTSAAGGGVICRYGALSDAQQVPVIIVSYLLIGLAMPLTIAYDAVFLSRLFDGSFPSKQQTYQVMILCGPLGQGSFALQILGEVVQRGSFAGYNRGVFLTKAAAVPVAYASEFLGLLSWGYGTFWWAFAVISLLHEAVTQSRKGSKFSFSLAAWSLVFPWGVYTNAAVQLGKLMDSAAFKVWSTVLTVLLVIIWVVNATLTAKGALSGKLLGLNS
ncbi:MAG: hypothetical protein M1830_001972 [Pleopsidium flavum]|nr:MAG: hypothetical protein M1830_001972 [Pleopsidium flavum]